MRGVVSKCSASNILLVSFELLITDFKNTFRQTQEMKIFVIKNSLLIIHIGLLIPNHKIMRPKN